MLKRNIDPEILKEAFKNPDKYIPKGNYCYVFTGKYIAALHPVYISNGGKLHLRPVHMEVIRCPFWDWDDGHPDQEHGYCHYMGLGDWQLNSGLLWDQCKECGIENK
jgi:hypothetical protein